MEETPFLETWQAFPWNGAQYIESSGFQTRARTVKVSPPHPFFQPHTCVLSHFFRGRRIDYIVEKKLALDSFLSLSPRSEFFEKLANEGKEFLIFFGEFFGRFPRLEFIGICRDNRIFQSVISFN